jgi:hypothetical protein
MKIIIIKNKQVFIDDEDSKFISRFTWHLHGPDEHPYARSSYKMLMHKMILGCANNYEVDHIDGNSLNNQKNNLRICSKINNQQNRNKYKEGLSKYKGVTRRKNGKWRARIRVNGDLIHLGDFNIELNAAQEYNRAAIHYFSHFANLNEINKLY